jgi:hypothetical protein
MQMMRVSKFLLLLPVTINAARFMLDTKPDEGKPNIRCIKTNINNSKPGTGQKE